VGGAAALDDEADGLAEGAGRDEASLLAEGIGFPVRGADTRDETDDEAVRAVAPDSDTPTTAATATAIAAAPPRVQADFFLIRIRRRPAGVGSAVFPNSSQGDGTHSFWPSEPRHASVATGIVCVASVPGGDAASNSAPSLVSGASCAASDWDSVINPSSRAGDSRFRVVAVDGGSTRRRVREQCAITLLRQWTFFPTNDLKHQ
jgi:hypothetical protein